MKKTLRGGNNWKVAGVLFLLAAFIGILMLVPVLRPVPHTKGAVDLPSLSGPVGSSQGRP
jgi:hypothetical protein